MEVLSFAPISNSDVQIATKWLQPSKLVRLDNISSFVIKVVLKFVNLFSNLFFNLSFSYNTFPNL
jgi:hypothetical protein